MEKCSRLKCFYAILGVEKHSSTAEIRTAYRKLAMKWHPDKCSNVKGEVREQAKLKFQAVQEAYSVLSDENKRLLYDAGLHEEVEEDPSMQDFIGELVNMMNGGPAVPSKTSKASSKSNADSEFEELRKLFMNIVDADNYIRDCQQFDYSCKGSTFGAGKTSSNQEMKSAAAANNTSCKQECQQFSLSCSSTGEKTTNYWEQPSEAATTPKPHANLYRAWDYEQFDFGSDALDDDYEFLTSYGNEAHPAPTSPEITPSDNLYGGDCRYFDFAPFSATSIVDEASLDSSPTNLYKRDCQQLDSTCAAFGAVRMSSRFDERRGTGSTVRPRASGAQGFCMGTSGSGDGRDLRGHVKHTKLRRNRCKDKVGSSPTSWCETCGQETLGLGFCFCNCSGGVNMPNAPSLFVS